MATINKYFFKQLVFEPAYVAQKDLAPVSAYSDIPLSEILASGVVPDDASVLDNYTPEVVEPGQIVGRVQDVFEALRVSGKLLDAANAAKLASVKSASTAAPATDAASTIPPSASSNTSE